MTTDRCRGSSSPFGRPPAGHLPDLLKRLERFRIALQGHLLKEDVRLYVYRVHLLQSDAISNDHMHGFRREQGTLYPMHSPPD